MTFDTYLALESAPLLFLSIHSTMPVVLRVGVYKAMPDRSTKPFGDIYIHTYIHTDGLDADVAVNEASSGRAEQTALNNPHGLRIT